MQRAVLIPILLACAPLGAQSTAKACTAPDGYLATAGGSYSVFLGYAANARQQFADGSVPKRKLLIGELAYRTQSQISYSSSTGMGRIWSAVSLTLGHTSDATKITTAFAKNYSSIGTGVFKAGLSFPTLTGVPTQRWGNVARIPFTKSFTYNGKDDVLFDFVFQSGKLRNGGGWTCGKTYLTDSVLSSTVAYLSPTWLPKSPFGSSGLHCNDSSQSAKVGAYAWYSSVVYGDAYPATSLRSRTQVTNSFTAYTAPLAPILAVLTAGGSDKGIPIGAACNSVHVNLGFPLAIILAKTGSGTARGPATGNYFPTTLSKYDDRFAGLGIYFQAAWDDSRTRRLSVTVASKITLPKMPRVQPKAVAAEYKCGDRTVRSVWTSSFYQTLPLIVKK